MSTNNTFIGRALRIAIEIAILGLLLSSNTNAATLTVCPDGCLYSSIQTAVNDSNDSDIIQVQSGTYYENVNVTKQLALQGIGMPVVNAGGNGSTITLSVNGSTLEGFKAIGSGLDTEAGINIISSDNVVISNNASNNYGNGISLSSSRNNTISGNNASNNAFGIRLDSSSNNTLSGNNVSSNSHFMSGISLAHSSDNNTLIGNNVWNNYNGIMLSYYSNNNTLIGNNASMNTDNGIELFRSRNNTLIGNIMTENNANFYTGGNTDLDFENYIDTSNVVDGRPMYYLIRTSDTIFDSSINIGTLYCISCVNVTIKNLNLSKNDAAIFFWNTTNSRIQNVNASYNYNGFLIYNSSNNTLIDNNLLNNDLFGVELVRSTTNKLIGNNASNNSYRGINMVTSSNNMLIGNNIHSNNEYGLFFHNSNDNTIIGNNFNLNNLYGIYFLSSSGNNSFYNNFFNNINNLYSCCNNYWNTTKISGINIIGGPYLGGNFWANPGGTGFSQNCKDEDLNGICDSSYLLASGNVDYLPLTIPAGYGYISGKVMNYSIYIAGAVVTTNISNTTNTDASGMYSLLVPAGTYSLTATSEPVYYPNSPVTISIEAGTNVIQDIELVRKPIGDIMGTVSG